MHRIVIVGGGAGGLELATRLGDKLGRAGKAHITLIDRSPTHVWKPLLHEVAAGSLDAHVHQIEFAAQAHWHHFNFVRGELKGLDRSSKTIDIATVHGGAFDDKAEILPSRKVEYDTLVLALGSRTHFFGVHGAEEHAITLDTLEQAEILRRRLLATCARKRTAGGNDDVNIAIIGGGATGVELAAELRRMEAGFRKYGLHPNGKSGDIKISLLEAGHRLLPALPERVGQTASSILSELGIEVSVADPVIEVADGRIQTKSGRAITSDITIWAAGIKAPGVLASLDGLAVNRINQLKVGRTLQSETDVDIFAIGDCASCSWNGERMVPPRAQAAHQQAVYLSKALVSRLECRVSDEFSYSDHGSLVSLGPSAAVGSLLHNSTGGYIFVKGTFAKLLYATLYRKHLAAVSTLNRACASLIIHAIRRLTMPRVKLH
ncbi:NAD(P)/FAD-dependent oxidoreductase [Paraburkholderia tropica]|uniref:NAD(P)/FAD-dependent oxidoreductase n=1 Tax=Paraburkholderia tropica TaxID=92647 RepID=UPI002AB67791|nr:NAD(P)/FAD-dependent oxidoreductase [Paraburkholderia tropica]